MSASSASAANAKWRILCIDDEPDILEILRVALGMKHEVVVAKDGLQGLGLLDFCEPDFIICDLRMPHMDGFQTVEAIRKHPRFFDIPVFFLTAETSRDAAKRGYATGANLYLTKPFDPTRVLQNIDFFLKEQGKDPRPKRFTPERAVEEFGRLSRAAEEPERAAAPALAEGAPVRVVVVCRNALQNEQIRAALQRPYECMICADPVASLRQIFQYDPDVLIINPAIPRVSGLGVAQLIRTNAAFRNLPILLLEDPEEPLDPRFAPAITKLPPLPANASASKIQAAVQDVTTKPSFRVRPKRSSTADLTAQENALRRSMEEESARAAREAHVVRERYRRVQSFIDKNLT
ncbi:MAG TPA: response regulator [Sumerlaeia bacterium]|nr:response regulator [Sumerlaeia bacterium]